MHDARTRILEAMAELMAERGAGASTVSAHEVILRAEVSGATFAELFADREACLLEAFELAVERAGPRIARAYDAEPRWLDGIKAGLAGLLGYLEDEPALGRLALVHAMGGGVSLLRRRMEVLAVLAGVVDRGRAEGPAGRRPPPEVIAEGVVGAVMGVIQNRLLAEEQRPVMELFGSLVSIVVLPYLGPTVARRELSRPAPRPRALPGAARAGTGAEARRTRLTYRTARVLRAIGEYPGASNREVAERAGIVDQGQISKLLGRLEKRGLIARIGEARAQGASNSWKLTARGEELASEALG